MLTIPSTFEQRLSQARTQSQLRELALPFGEDYCSNDYLGFARDPELPLRLVHLGPTAPGSTGSRLLRGDSELHREVENQLARFSRREAALLFPSGYQANVGVFSSLLRVGDTAYSDAANHASIIDGLRLSGCDKRVFRHGDLAHLEELLNQDQAQTRSALKIIASESLFSMDGDFAKIPQLISLADRYDAWLVLDEAHATGLGGAGRAAQLGNLSPRVLATIHTGGKGLGAAGAWVASSNELKSYFLNFSRAQIFSTSISPLLAQTLAVAVQYHSEVGSERNKELQTKIDYFHGLTGIPLLSNTPEKSPIIPWVLGAADRTLQASRNLREQGLDVRAIRPPTVAEGQSRLRITLKWSNSLEGIARLASALGNLDAEKQL